MMCHQYVIFNEPAASVSTNVNQMLVWGINWKGEIIEIQIVLFLGGFF